MFHPLNEFKYKATTGLTYIVYFLKFWPATDTPNDYIVKYQIRESDKDLFWYGRISKARFIADVEISEEDMKSMSKKELENKIQEHLKKLFIHVTKKALDRGWKETNTEFVFYEEPPILKRVWKE